MMDYKRKELKNECVFIIAGILSVAIAFGFNLNLNNIYNHQEKALAHIVGSIEGNSLVMVFFAVIVFFLALDVFATLKQKVLSRGLVCAAIVISAGFSVMIPIGRAYRYDNSLSLIITNYVQVIKALLIILAWFFILFFIILLSYRAMKEMKSYSQNIDSSLLLKICGFMSKKPWYILIFSVIRYLFVFIVYYPGILMGDTVAQISEAFGAKIPYLGLNRVYEDSTLTNMHPVVDTLLYRLFMGLGKRIFGSYNVGLYIMLICQSLFLIVVISMIFFFFLRNTNHPRFVFLIMVFFYINPMITNYMLLASKDVLYTTFLLLFTFELLLDAVESQYGKRTVLFISMIGTSLFRGEGFYIVLISYSVYSFIRFLKRKRKIEISRVIMPFLVIFINLGLSYILFPFFHIEAQAPNQKMSVPVQQIARYVCDDYPFTEEEKTIINNVVNYDELRDKYIPSDADGVKYIYKAEASHDDRSAFIRLWGKTVLKSPGIAISAFVNNKYEYFYLEDTGLGRYNSIWSESMMESTKTYLPEDRLDMNLSYPRKTKTIREEYDQIMELIIKSPIISLIMCPAVYTLMIFVLLCFYHNQKKIIGIVLLTPPILVLLITCMFSAVNASYGRYMYPIVVIMVLAVLYLTFDNNQTCIEIDMLKIRKE